MDHGLDALRLGFAYEALARASAVAEETTACAQHLARAREHAGQVAAADDDQWLEENLATVNR
ncbi:MAG: hypothetical protein M0Z54_09745 [Thermaerobacter sp.]|nr:hypothetical protein [Thermaerobacter sp.]